MKRRIRSSMALLSFVTILLTALTLSGVVHDRFNDSAKDEVRRESRYFAEVINSGGSPDFIAWESVAGSKKIIHVGPEGSPIHYSSKTPYNHDIFFSNPEVVTALDTGQGEAVRLSDTLDSITFFYAVRLDDGGVVLAESTTESKYSMYMSLLPDMLFVAGLIYILAVFFSNRQAHRIIDPLNALNLDEPMSNNIYDELSPLLTRINQQNRQINDQLKRYERQQEEFYSITENMREGLVVLSSSATIISINRSARLIFNLQENVIIQSHFYFLSRDMSLQRAVENALKGTEGEILFERNGRRYQVMVTPVVVNDKTRGAVLLILDATERLKADQLRREFTANVSHELKTPLTSISGYAEIMKNGIAKQDDMQQFSERIYDEASRMITLVNDIIKLSKLDENSGQLPQEKVDLLTLSEEIRERLTPIAEKKNITISVSGETAPITGVKALLNEMIFNLCDNAIKYTEPGGSIDVKTSVKNGKTAISIRDNGIGIPKKYQDRVFERFYRVDSSHSKETGGTGLGLSIVKHGALYHKADIKLTSAPGKGTTIKLTFPNL